MDCSLPGSSVHGIIRAKILEWVAISFPRYLPDPGIKPGSPAFRADSLLTIYKGRNFLDTYRKSLWWDKFLKWVFGNLDPKKGSCTDMLVSIHLTKSAIPKNKVGMRLVDFWDPPASKISMILSFYRKIKDQQKLSQMEEQSRVIKWLLKRGQLSFFFFIIQNKVLQLSQSIHYIIWVANDGSLSWIKNSLWLGLFKVAKPTFLILILINWCCNY